MMRVTKWLTAAALATVAGLFLAMGTATAQRHGGGGGHGGGYGGYSGGHAPVSHGIYYGHSNWNYVVPQYPRYAGGYYSVGQSYYYTPTPIVPYLSSPVATAPPPAVAPQKPVELTFGGFARYQDLAGRLTLDANALLLDMHHNYQGNKNFADAYGEAYGVLQAAKYLQGNEHSGDKDTIRKRVADMHRRFHHVMDEMRDWNRIAKKQVGTGAMEDKTAAVEAVLHHLVYDTGIKPEERAPGTALPVVDPQQEAPPPIGKR